MSLALLEKAVYVARNNIGYGETEANNRGRFIDLIGGDRLTVEDPAWCALFAGYCYRRACELLGIDPPDWLFRRPGVPEAGARNLVMGMGQAGCFYKDPSLARPGDLGLNKRAGGHHVWIVSDEFNGRAVGTIEGNLGRFPSLVKPNARFVHGREPGFVTFASVVDA